MGKSFLINYQGQELSLAKVAEMNRICLEPLLHEYQQTGDIEQAIALSKAAQKYIDFCGKKMTINQIAQIYDIDYRNLRAAYKLTSDIDEAITLALNENFIIDGEKKYRAYQTQENAVSIHKLKNLAYIFDETGFKVDHTLLNNNFDPIAIVEDKMLNEGLKAQIQRLPDREQQFLRLRYGLDDGIERSRTKVATMLHLSRTTLMESRALRKLRHPNFEGYYDVTHDRLC
ncbi:MAG: hypothetical protein MJ060_03515 [Clostridia bacterium]|nr:hypothetical protein [Clostridia bacterium]